MKLAERIEAEARRLYESYRAVKPYAVPARDGAPGVLLPSWETNTRPDVLDAWRDGPATDVVARIVALEDAIEKVRTLAEVAAGSVSIVDRATGKLLLGYLPARTIGPDTPPTPDASKDTGRPWPKFQP